MGLTITRRSLLVAGCALLALPGCAVIGGGYGYEQAIRRLLTVSSQRAFAGLLRENGFFEDQVARVTLPPQLGGGGAASVLAALLQTEAVQTRLLRQVNYAAQAAAEAATPLVMQSIQNMRLADAAAIVNGGSSAATEYLQRSMGTALVDAMLPGVANALRVGDDQIVAQALQVASGIDFAALQSDVARKASDGIYRAIGREEAAIRANPASTNDPLLIGIFGFGRR